MTTPPEIAWAFAELHNIFEEIPHRNLPYFAKRQMRDELHRLLYIVEDYFDPNPLDTSAEED